MKQSKIAVMGGGGQVGAEVCLRLSVQSDLQVVPICRNRTSSAFLRYAGVSCRHGIVTNPEEAPQLLGDCDLVANFALASGLPSKASAINTALVTQSITASPPAAKIIYFSTVMVYGEPAPDAVLHPVGAYGQEKLRCEKLALELGKKHQKDVFVFRLGHVCGEHQNITQTIRSELRAGPIALPNGGRCASNVVYTASVVEAMLRALEGHVSPGTYDLLAEPQLTWREVYEYEASQIGVPLQVEEAGSPPTPSLTKAVTGVAKDLINRSAQAWLPDMSTIRKAGDNWLSHLPPKYTQRIKAMYSTKRIQAEINAIPPEKEPTPLRQELSWRPLDLGSSISLTPALALLAEGRYPLPEADDDTRFPPDLPDATFPRMAAAS